GLRPGPVARSRRRGRGQSSHLTGCPPLPHAEKYCAPPPTDPTPLWRDTGSCRVRVYLTAARLSFRRYITYRSAAAAGAITNTSFGFIRAYILLAMWHEKPQIGTYDAADAVTYVFLTQGLIMPIGVFLGSTELGARIRTGEVATHLYRPCDLQLWFLATDLGRAFAALILRTAPPILVGMLALPTRLPTDPRRWLEFALCCGLALVISFGLRYAVSLSAFWTLDERGTA